MEVTCNISLGGFDFDCYSRWRWNRGQPRCCNIWHSHWRYANTLIRTTCKKQVFCRGLWRPKLRRESPNCRSHSGRETNRKCRLRRQSGHRRPRGGTRVTLPTHTGFQHFGLFIAKVQMNCQKCNLDCMRKSVTALICASCNYAGLYI